MALGLMEYSEKSGNINSAALVDKLEHKLNEKLTYSFKYTHTKTYCRYQFILLKLRLQHPVTL
jgi:hypothetical protein